MLIVITGASGSGKSILSSYLASLNSKMLYINIDEIGHEVIQRKDVIKCLVKAFNILPLSDGSIDRKELAKIVFNSNAEMDKLTEITWKYMKTELNEIIKINKEKIIILDWLLITKTKFFDESDIKILIKADLKVRMARSLKRDKITEKMFLEREKAALKYDENVFDYVINNNDIELSKRKVKKLYDKSIIPREF